MLKRLYRCVVRLHPSSFRRRFGDEMLYIFDQQMETASALGVFLDCLVSLIRQWTLRPHIVTESSVAPLRSAAADHIYPEDSPSFGSLDPFRPRRSAIINGALLSLILFYATIFALRYSWVHFVDWNLPATAADQTSPPTRSWFRHSNPRKASKHLQVDVIPTEADDSQNGVQIVAPNDPQSKAIAPTSAQTSAVAVPTRGAVISLDPYVGKYISYNPPAEVSFQIEGEPLSNHLSLSLAGTGHSSLALSPVSGSRFVIVGSANSYVDFTNDAEGKICCVSFVANGNVITAQRR